MILRPTGQYDNNNDTLKALLNLNKRSDQSKHTHKKCKKNKTCEDIKEQLSRPLNRQSYIFF